MKKRTKRLMGGIALAAGALGVAGAFLRKKNVRTKLPKKVPNVWARPGMTVTFRAELMPGREGDDRTFRVKELLPSGRVLLHGVDGEHAEKEFERVQ
ncbi:MAG TPA: hypothetical protein VL866_05855 [Pyrinomonadaceae bacterium]|nr:hypothetical protein [Pyrinomonadaceae bacterium]